MDERLSEPTGSLGEPRFHPPGSHPALQRMKQELERLECAGLGDHELAVYYRERIASFEEGESEAKARYLAWRGEDCQ